MKTTKRNLMSAAIAAMVLGTAASAQAANDDFYYDGYHPIDDHGLDSGGDYRIYNYGDLKAFAIRVNTGNTKINGMLMADITATDTDWTPIGTGRVFSGIFDGQGHTITGLDNAGASPENAGLFGHVHGCTVRNVGVVGGNFSAVNFVGGIVGWLDGGGVVEGCFFSGSVTSDPSGSSRAGGIVGNHNSGIVRNCHSAGSIVGHDAGGIVGYQFTGTVRNCHSTASLKGYNVGGIAGEQEETYGTVETCYFAGYRPSESDYTFFGAIVGSVFKSTVSHCYYDAQKASPGVGEFHPVLSKINCVEGLLTQYFTTPGYFAGFDFGNIWYMGESCPLLCAFLAKYPYADPADEANPVKTAACIPITESTTTLRSHWYVVNSTVALSGRIAVDGDANLILGDGCVLRAYAGIELAGANRLTVWCQGGGSGTLIANGHDDDAAIGGHGYSSEAGSAQPGGALTIHGGTVTATAGGAGAGIGGGGVGNTGNDDAGDGGMVRIDGGTVRAVSEGAGAGIGGGGRSGFGFADGGKGGTVVLCGGTVTAGSEDGGVAIGGGRGSGGDANGALCFAGSLGVVAAQRESNLASLQPVDCSVRVAACHSNKWAKVSPCQRDHGSLAGPCSVCGLCPPVSYIDLTDTENPEKTRTGCFGVFDEMEMLHSGWYALAGNATLAHRLAVAGDVNLILADGATLTAEEGIRVAAGDSLAIWGQGNQSGELVAVNGGGDAAIGGDANQDGGDVAIHGGTVEVSTGNSGAQAIGGGSGGGTAGALAIDGMRVFASATDMEPVVWAQREGVCRGEWARIAPCAEHDYDKYGICLFCGMDGGELNLDPVSYLDPTLPGSTSRTVRAYTLLTNQSVLATGWYVVQEDAQIGSRIQVEGDVNLILCDGAELTAAKGFRVRGEYRLTVWGQSTDETKVGKLTCGGMNSSAGIGGNFQEAGGIITINGGFVTANGGWCGAGIGGGNGGNGGGTTINGGFVTASGGEYGAGIGGGDSGRGGTITINGGTVTANGSGVGAGIGGGQCGPGGTITIHGGMVTAKGGRWSAGIGGGQDAASGTITIDGGMVTAITESSDAQAIGHGGDESAAAGSLAIDGMRVFASASATEPVAAADRVGVCRGVWAKVEVCPHEYGPEGVCLHCGKYIPYAGQTTLAGGFYEVDADRTVEGRIEVLGDVTLLLCDGAELTAAQGFHVTGTNSLTVWAQSGERATAGKLTIPGPGDSMAGIGGNDGEPGGTVTVNGGVLDVTGGRKAGAIGGGRGGAGGVITINEGFVTANGGELGTGLGGGMAKGSNSTAGNAGVITINGGEVAASGGSCNAGIGGGAGLDEDSGSSGGTIAINGGTVTARGGSWGAGIGGGQWSGDVTVVVRGGAVTATAGSAGAQAIGGGRYWSGVAGRLSIVGMKVYDSRATMYAVPDEPVAAALREDACRSRWAGLRVCEAHNDAGNDGLCDRCGMLGGPIRYWDLAGGTNAVCTAYAPCTGENTLTSGWWGVAGVVTHPSRVEVAGDVHLVLCDGADLMAAQGFHVTGANSLTIWAQGTNSASAGTLTIPGPGDSMAGIGGNDGEPGGTVTVNGGMLDVTGGRKAGAIGGGRSGAGGVITVNGGFVTATGGELGTGLGGGMAKNENYVSGNAGSITINGGEVTATGGNHGAGIGGGGGSKATNGSSGGTVTINGGTVTATGGAAGAGIGAGRYAGGVTVVVCGGTVTAVAGDTAEAIGEGYGWSGVAGSLVLDGMKVFASASAAEPVASANRENTCRSGWAKLEVCPHEYENGVCHWCGEARPVLDYAAWAAANGVTGAWNATDAGGIHNVFRYAFDKPTGAFTNPPLLSISFDALGRPVILTPPLVNGEGFTLSILATDDLASTGATTYPLDAGGETVIPKTETSSRFFRLKAAEQ